ncbi:MAG TPA: DUF707 domain-containing protein [Burkholderiaceae bacterium]|nr:DUF707 domain-containing protein [Burkholderiaceae bacterium]
MKPYLALFRAGPNSLHPHAVERLDEQNFDYALSWFGDESPAADGAAFVHMQKGAKWPGLERTLIEHWDTIQQYEYVWLPDDDLLCQPELVSRMFAICHDLQLELAQPALTRDSYFSHLITLQHTEFQLRFTNFVEIMAPVLSTDMLARVFPTLAGNVSGWGLDTLWARLTQLGKVAIIDDTPVKHTRPVGGPNYAFSKAVGMTPAQEAVLTMTRYGIETPADVHLNFAGLLQSGNPICIGQSTFEIDQMLKKLIASTNGTKVSALHLTRYLGNHLNYWMGGIEQSGRSNCSRDLLRVVLNHTLAHAGIAFPTAGESSTAAQETARSIAAQAH